MSSMVCAGENCTNSAREKVRGREVRFVGWRILVGDLLREDLDPCVEEEWVELVEWVEVFILRLGLVDSLVMLVMDLVRVMREGGVGGWDGVGGACWWIRVLRRVMEVRSSSNGVDMVVEHMGEVLLALGEVRGE